MWYHKTMRRKINLIVGVLMFLITAFCGNVFVLKNTKAAQADSVKTINYVALGDSIAAGNLLNGWSEDIEYGINGNAETTILASTYTGLFESNTSNVFGANLVNAVSYARSGDKVQDLMDKLTHENVRDSIKNADIVTICIGANNILGPALKNIYDFVKSNPSLNVYDMNDLLDEGLKEIRGENGYFKKLLKELDSIGSNAKFIFTNVYNPYKNFGIQNDDWTDSLIGLFLDLDNLNMMGSEANVYINGGTNRSGEHVIGLNEILTDGINSWVNEGHENYYIVDNYTAFNNYTGKYSDLVNCWITKDHSASQIFKDFDWGNDNLEREFQEAVDPHPRVGGYSIMFETFKNAICYASFNTNGGEPIKDQVFIKGKRLTTPTTPVKNENIFAGWYKDQNFNTLWNFDNDIVSSNITLYSKWEQLECTNESDGVLNQYVNDTKKNVNFFINISKEVKWYVNGVLQEGQTGFTYSYFPPNEAGTYSIYCSVDGVQSNSFEVNVKYYTPSGLIIKEVLTGIQNKFEFTIFETSANLNNMNAEKCYWYKTATGHNAEKFATGFNVLIELDQSTAQEYEIYAVYEGDTTLTSNTLKIAKTYIVAFDSCGGTYVESRNVAYNKKILKPINPTTQNTAKPIFAGWYKEKTYQNLWNFDNDTVSSNITLYAKWTNLVCNNEELLLQTIANRRSIQFIIDVVDSVEWYVNNELLKNETLTTLNFTPPESIGEYYVYCIVNKIKSKTYIINIDYETPTSLTIIETTETNSLHIYSFIIENSEYIDETKCYWYKSINGNKTSIEDGIGFEIQLYILEECYIFAEYQDDYKVESNKIKIIPVFKVIFNTNGGNTIEEQTINYNQKIIKPINPVKSTYIFGGWYTKNFENLWDFESGLVTNDIVLYAKWERLECTNPEAITQFLNNIRTAHLKINVQEHVLWYVNNSIQTTNANVLEFKPEENKVAEYVIYCVVNDVVSNSITIKVNYLVPKQINIYIQKATNNNVYEFVIDNGTYIDASLCYWYKKIDNENEDIILMGTGNSLTCKIEEDCGIYAVYEGETDIKSNVLTIIPDKPLSNNLFIIGGAAGGVTLLVIVLFILGKRKYKGYY